MMIVSDDTIWSTTYDRNWWRQLRLELGRIVNYDHDCSFIVLATVLTIVNYDRKTFIVQARFKNCLEKSELVSKERMQLTRGQCNKTFTTVIYGFS